MVEKVCCFDDDKNCASGGTGCRFCRANTMLSREQLEKNIADYKNSRDRTLVI